MRGTYTGDDDPQGIEKSMVAPIAVNAQVRLARARRLSAGKEYGCGRRDRSPKSGVETLGKSALQKAKCTYARHLYSGMTTHKALTGL